LNHLQHHHERQSTTLVTPTRFRSGNNNNIKDLECLKDEDDNDDTVYHPQYDNRDWYVLQKFGWLFLRQLYISVQVKKGLQKLTAFAFGKFHKRIFRTLRKRLGSLRTRSRSGRFHQRLLNLRAHLWFAWRSLKRRFVHFMSVRKLKNSAYFRGKARGARLFLNLLTRKITWLQNLRLNRELSSKCFIKRARVKAFNKLIRFAAREQASRYFEEEAFFNALRNRFRRFHRLCIIKTLTIRATVGYERKQKIRYLRKFIDVVTTRFEQRREQVPSRELALSNFFHVHTSIALKNLGQVANACILHREAIERELDHVKNAKTATKKGAPPKNVGFCFSIRKCSSPFLTCFILSRSIEAGC
jgi:hypothetical protein